MRQDGLIDHCIKALGLDSETSNTTTRPSSGNPLPRDSEGEPASEEFDYASVVGMMMYLAGWTHNQEDLVQITPDHQKTDQVA